MPLRLRIFLTSEKVWFWCMLVLLSWAGCLLRLLILYPFASQAVGGGQFLATSYSAVFPLLYVQCLGCFIMGMLKKSTLEKITIVVLGTGFCGSLTTFSSWMFDVFVVAVGLDTARGTGLAYGLFAAVVIIAVTVGLCWSAMEFGEFVGHGIVKALERRRFELAAGASVAAAAPTQEEIAISAADSLEGLDAATQELPLGTRLSLVWAFVNGLVLASYVAMVVVGWIVLLSNNLEANSDLYAGIWALQLAPLGTFLRYALGIRFNRDMTTTPTYERMWFHHVNGTFIANLLGVNLLGLLMVPRLCITAGKCGNSPLTLVLLGGATSGFCGCLTTLSTLITELRRFQGLNGIGYLATSIFFSLLSLGFFGAISRLFT